MRTVSNAFEWMITNTNILCQVVHNSGKIVVVFVKKEESCKIERQKPKPTKPPPLSMAV